MHVPLPAEAATGRAQSGVRAAAWTAAVVALALLAASASDRSRHDEAAVVRAGGLRNAGAAGLVPFGVIFIAPPLVERLVSR